MFVQELARDFNAINIDEYLEHPSRSLSDRAIASDRYKVNAGSTIFMPVLHSRSLNANKCSECRLTLPCRILLLAALLTFSSSQTVLVRPFRHTLDTFLNHCLPTFRELVMATNMFNLPVRPRVNASTIANLALTAQPSNTTRSPSHNSAIQTRTDNDASPPRPLRPHNDAPAPNHSNVLCCSDCGSLDLEDDQGYWICKACNTITKFQCVDFWGTPGSHHVVVPIKQHTPVQGQSLLSQAHVRPRPAEFLAPGCGICGSSNIASVEGHWDCMNCGATADSHNGEYKAIADQRDTSDYGREGGLDVLEHQRQEPQEFEITPSFIVDNEAAMQRLGGYDSGNTQQDLQDFETTVSFAAANEAAIQRLRGPRYADNRVKTLLAEFESESLRLRLKLREGVHLSMEEDERMSDCLALLRSIAPGPAMGCLGGVDHENMVTVRDPADEEMEY